MSINRFYWTTPTYFVRSVVNLFFHYDNAVEYLPYKLYETQSLNHFLSDLLQKKTMPISNLVSFQLEFLCTFYQQSSPWLHLKRELPTVELTLRA
jgi:hypothetical protein